MKNILFISNRQSGKSTIAKYEFLKNPEETIMICCKKQMINGELLKYKNILTQNNEIRSFKVKRLILDEYFFFSEKNKKRLFELTTKDYPFEEILIFSTPNKIYNEKLLNFVREHYPINDINQLHQQFIEEAYPDGISTNLESALYDEITELSYNFIANPYFKIIDNDCFKNQKIRHNKDITRNFESLGTYIS